MRILIGILVLIMVPMFQCCYDAEVLDRGEKVIDLPEPKMKGDTSLEEVIASRRSVRSFSDERLDMEQIGQLLWAAQGITDEGRGLRAAPSAGALYPLEVFAVTREGAYQYLPKGHSLRLMIKGDIRDDLYRSALMQSWVKNAPVVFVIVADYPRTTRKYGERGTMYVHMEAGHCAQNIHLQAVALGLASVPVGAFSEKGVAKALSLPEEITPLYLIPVGYKK